MPAHSTTIQSSIRTSERPGRLNRHLFRHYAEMIVVMMLGMGVLGLPSGWALDAAGSSWSALRSDGPALLLALMALTMAVPMLAWMRLRGHAWQPTLEMCAAMVVPTLAAIALLAATVVRDVGTLLVIEHAAMFTGMFAVMLARPDEYSRHRGATT